MASTAVVRVTAYDLLQTLGLKVVDIQLLYLGDGLPLIPGKMSASVNRDHVSTRNTRCELRRGSLQGATQGMTYSGAEDAFPIKRGLSFNLKNRHVHSVFRKRYDKICKSRGNSIIRWTILMSAFILHQQRGAS